MNEEEQYKKAIESDRMDYAVSEIMKLGYIVTHQDETKLQFEFKGENVTMFPYTGWHTGKSITDGRGIKNLLKQIK